MPAEVRSPHEVSENVSLVAAKLFLESMQSMRPEVVRDTASRARVAIVGLMARCAPWPSDVPLAGPSSKTASNGWSPVKDGTSDGTLHRGAVVYQLLEYLQKAKSTHHAPEAGRASDGVARGGSKQLAADERALRDSETQVIHILATFIVSSPSTLMSADVRRAFQDHMVFLVFAAVAQLRCLEAEGRDVGILNAPAATSHGALDSVPPLPPSMDYYWLAYYVLLLVGGEGVRDALLRLGEPLAPIHDEDDGTRGRQCHAMVADGLHTVGSAIVQLCVSYGRVLTNERASPENVLAAAGDGVETRVDRSGDDFSPTNGSLRATVVTVGDVLAHARLRAHAEYRSFPPPRLEVLLGRSKPPLRPSRKRLDAPAETLHVLPRLSGVVTAVVESLCDCDIVGSTDHNTSASYKRHATHQRTTGGGNNALASLLLVWTLRLSAYATVLCLGGGAAQVAERRNTVRAALSCAHLLVRLHVHRQQREHHAHPRPTTAQPHPLMLRHVLSIALQVAILGRWEPSAADVLQSLLAHAATRVGHDHAAVDASPTTRASLASASECFSAVALDAMEGVMVLVDAVEVCCVPSSEAGALPSTLEFVGASIQAVESTVALLVADVRAHLVDAMVQHRRAHGMVDAADASPQRTGSKPSAQQETLGRPQHQRGAVLHPTATADDDGADSVTNQQHHWSCTLECLGALASLLGTWRRQYIGQPGEASEALWHLAITALEVARNHQAERGAHTGTTTEVLAASSNGIAPFDPTLLVAQAGDGCWYNLTSLRHVQSGTDQHRAGSCTGVINAAATGIGPFETALRLFTRSLVVLSDHSDDARAMRQRWVRGYGGADTCGDESVEAARHRTDVPKMAATLSEAFAQLLFVTPQAPRSMAADLCTAATALHEQAYHIGDGSAAVALLEKECALYGYRWLALRADA